MELTNFEIFNVPNRRRTSTFMAISGVTLDGKIRYAMPYDERTFDPLEKVISKAIYRRRFFFFGESRWVYQKPIALFSPEGCEVRRCFSLQIPELQRNLDQMMYDMSTAMPEIDRNGMMVIARIKTH